MVAHEHQAGQRTDAHRAASAGGCIARRAVDDRRGGREQQAELAVGREHAAITGAGASRSRRRDRVEVQQAARVAAAQRQHLVDDLGRCQQRRAINSLALGSRLVCDRRDQRRQRRQHDVHARGRRVDRAGVSPVDHAAVGRPGGGVDTAYRQHRRALGVERELEIASRIGLGRRLAGVPAVVAVAVDEDKGIGQVIVVHQAGEDRERRRVGDRETLVAGRVGQLGRHAVATVDRHRSRIDMHADLAGSNIF